MDNQQKSMTNAWRHFVDTGEIPEIMPTIIRDSWAYCRSIGLDPVKPGPGHSSQRELTALFQECSFLQTAAHNTIHLLEEVIMGTDFLVTLTNQNGEILEIVGDPDIIEMAGGNNYVRGASRATSAVGTNAIGLACDIGTAVQVSGCEHYHQLHHNWSCAAAPIFGPEGDLLGVICFSGKFGQLQRHTMGMAVAAARAIEREMAITTTNRTLNKNAQLLEAVLNSMETGLIVVDSNGVILKVNPTACRLAGLPEDGLVGHSVSEVLEVSALDLVSNENFTDLKNYRPGTLIIGHSPKRTMPVMVKGSLLFDEDGHAFARVFIFEERRAVHRMAQKLVGPSVHFTFDDIIAKDPAMAGAISAAKSYAPFNSRVIIQGESGVGKEMFAQAIHNGSLRRTEPFVAINCGAVPRDLIESEFFGYEEGAFTGAKRGGKMGKVELAHRGTLFLDEVNSMPLDMQVKLLRFLQEGTFTRLGGTEEVRADVRIISAGNVNFEAEVRAGNFRSDLYYRLSTAVVNIPPLRERPADIVELINTFLPRKARELGKNIIGLNDEAWESVKKYHWPGNVRELENIVERAIILAQGPQITPLDLPIHLQQMPLQPLHLATAQTLAPANGMLAKREKELICQMLARTGYNISRAAGMLGVSRKTLYNKIRVYNIARDMANE